MTETTTATRPDRTTGRRNNVSERRARRIDRLRNDIAHHYQRVWEIQATHLVNDWLHAQLRIAHAAEVPDLESVDVASMFHVLNLNMYYHLSGAPPIPLDLAILRRLDLFSIFSSSAPAVSNPTVAEHGETVQNGESAVRRTRAERERIAREVRELYEAHTACRQSLIIVAATLRTPRVQLDELEKFVRTCDGPAVFTFDQNAYYRSYGRQTGRPQDSQRT